MTRLAGLVAGLAAVAAAACYAPSPQAGSPCGNGEPCASGLVCSPATQTCERVPIAVDAAPGVDAGLCFGGGGLVRVCLAAAPEPQVVLASETIDTDASPRCAAYDGSALCVIAAGQLVVGGAVRAIGKRPLVLVGESIAVSGVIDVASHRIAGEVSPGAGAGGALCLAGESPAQKAGGPGGTFGGPGGDGGLGSGNTRPASAPVAPIVALRAGCAGRTGSGQNPGDGGDGGGAVYLIARSTIIVNGMINASGAGGEGATTEGGGGGGGTGGMIGLDAPSVLASGAMVANGGGGGEGAGGISGNDGDDPDPAAAGAPARGGQAGSPNGGDGGDGAAGATLAGEDGANNTNTAGGGGGGGGAGVIRVFPAQPLGGLVSPPAS